MVKVKVCGITRIEDARLAVDAGVWAVGFVFVQNSPRHITPQKVAEIIENLPLDVEKVGVFVNSTLDDVAKIAADTGITKIQLHGEETPDYCGKIAEMTGKKVIKALRIVKEWDVNAINSYKPCVSYILLDSYSGAMHGGTGKAFDWEIAKKAKNFRVPLILAGGLTPDNIMKAYKEVKPFALDLSSGVEQSKGIKSPELLLKLKSSIQSHKAKQ